MTHVISDTPRPLYDRLLALWPLGVGLAVIGIPTLARLGSQVWSSEAGAHGPIVLATGLWLLWRQTDDLRKHSSHSRWLLTVAILLVSLALYVFGRAYDFISLEVLGVYAVGVTFLYAHFGLPALVRNWFPLFYLGFVVPPPGWLIDGVTAPLKEFVSLAATGILQAVGVPIIREGVTLMVDQYQLLVEDACSGMNSLVGLTAISLFYIYLLRRASWQYSVMLTTLVIPIAILANVVRIMVLVLLTYFMGDAVAQGFLHNAAGLFLFGTSLLMVFAVDHLLAAILLRQKTRA